MERFLLAIPLCAVLSCGVLPAAEGQAVVAAPPTLQESPFFYDAAHEMTFVGTIQKADSGGRPAGFHLLMATSGGVIDTHLGPYLSKDLLQDLHVGQTIQVVGVLHTFRGENHLLVRQLVVGDRQVTVRNEHGFLIRSQPAGGVHSRQSQDNLNGDRQ
jgi:hypothetical protein